MSTQANLSIGADFINSFMIDTCSVTRDTQDVRDDTLDLVTLKLKRPYNDKETLYTGICLVQPHSARVSLPVPTGGITLDEPLYKVLFPLTAPSFRLNDVITITSAGNDLSLINKVFRVFAAQADSNRVYKVVITKDITLFPQQQE